MDIKNKNYLNHLTRMSFRELKNELAKCNNKEIELIIRKIMKDKAIRYKLRQKSIKNNEIIDSILDDIETNSSKITSLNELDDYENDMEYQNINSSYKDEIAKDFVNNSLMERMNSELDIRNIKNIKRKCNEKDFIPPFSDNSGDNFAPFVYKKKLNDFSNKKFLK